MVAKPKNRYPMTASQQARSGGMFNGNVCVLWATAKVNLRELTSSHVAFADLLENQRQLVANAKIDLRKLVKVFAKQGTWLEEQPAVASCNQDSLEVVVKRALIPYDFAVTSNCLTALRAVGRPQLKGDSFCSTFGVEINDKIKVHRARPYSPDDLRKVVFTDAKVCELDGVTVKVPELPLDPVCAGCGLKTQYWLRCRIENGAYFMMACGVTANGDEIGFTVDHVVPLSRGGVDNISNYQAMCWKCNQHKGAL